MAGRFAGAARKKLIKRSPPARLSTVVSRVFSSMDRTKHESSDTRRKRDPPDEVYHGDHSEHDDSSLSENDDDSVPHPPGYPCKTDNTNLILGYSEEDLDMALVYDWLLLAEKGLRYGDIIMTLPPKKPSGGQILLYRTRKTKDLDHHRDEYTGFEMYSTNMSKQNQPVYKKYFRMTDADKNPVPFKKFTYELKSSKDKPNKVVLIHYVGDCSLFKERSHGNCKSGRTYTRSTEKVLEDIQNELETSKQNPQAVYDKVVKTALSDNAIKSREAVLTARNRKQTENLKHKLDKNGRLMRCDIFSLIEMGRNRTLGGFILRHLVNPFDIIIMAEPSALKLASHLLQAANIDTDIEQCLCYDTTFLLGDAYVSVLVMRNTYCVGQPIIPIAYMIHERKLQAVHVEFFRVMRDEIFFDALRENVPIVTDREIGIINAILTVEPKANICLCTNHIKQDVRRWVKDAGGRGDDLIALKGHVKRLLACETENEFDDYYSSVEPMWSQAFKVYMREHLHDDIKTRSCRSAVNRFAIFKDKQVTNNASESFNFMIKNQNQCKELRIDSLVLSLFNLQLNKIREVHRAFQEGGVGEFIVKEAYKGKACPVIPPQYLTYSTEMFLNLFKAEVYQASENIEKEQNYMQSRSALAKLTCENNLVSLDSRSGCFVVTGVYSGRRLIVQRKADDTLSCTCNSSGFCYHKLAVLYALNIETSDDRENYSLTLLRKKTRSAKRTGRKQPNADDFINNVDPAPDSDISRMKNQSSKQTADSNEDEVVSNKDAPTKKPQGVVVEAPPSDDVTDDDVQGLSIHSASSNSSNKSFEAIHHYSQKDFVDPENAEAVPRNSLSGARSVSSDADLPQALRISGTPATLPKAWLQTPTYQCLGPDQWIMEDIYNDMTRLMIKSLQMEESVSFVNTHEFASLLTKRKYRDFVNFAVRSQGLNSDVVLVNIRASSHFFFAVILYRRKEIVIVDSMKSKLPGTSAVYLPLIMFVAATYYVGLVEFDVIDWKVILETDLEEQPNGYDCGPFAIFNEYRMLRKLQFQVGHRFPASSTLRRWILNCLHTEESRKSVLLPRAKKVKRLFPKIKHFVESLLETLDIPDSALRPQVGSRSVAIAEELRVATQNWFPCAAQQSCKATEDSFEFLLCCYCRGWFHQDSCVNADDAKADYFLCQSCKQQRIHA